MKDFIVLLLIMSFLISCKDKEERAVVTKEKVKISIDPSDSIFYTSEIIDSAEYYLIDGDENNLFGDISKVIHYKEDYYLLDSKHSKSIFIFDSEWKQKFKIQNPGQGPGELLSLMDFSINKYSNSIDILDNVQKKIVKFDLSGNFTNSEIKFQPWGFCFGIVGDNQYAISSKQIYNPQYPNDLHIILNDGSVDEKYFLSNDKLVMNYSTKTCFYYNSSGSLLYKPNYSDTLFSLSNSIQPYCIVDFGNRKLPNDFLFKSAKDLRESNYAYHISNYIESDRYIYFKFVYKNTIKHAIYSKKQKNIKYGYKFVSDYDGLSFIGEAFFDNLNRLVIIYPGYICEFYKEPENKEYFSKLSKKLKDTINNSSEFTNGLVAIYTLKSF